MLTCLCRRLLPVQEGRDGTYSLAYPCERVHAGEGPCVLVGRRDEPAFPARDLELGEVGAEGSVGLEPYVPLQARWRSHGTNLSPFAEHGTMFYSNCWSDPEKSGTRKKIHGGSGDVNTGDGYPPHSTSALTLNIHPLAY